MPCNVEGKARLADAGTCGDGHQGSWRQAGEHQVEIAETRRQAEEGGFVLGFMEPEIAVVAFIAHVSDVLWFAVFGVPADDEQLLFCLLQGFKRGEVFVTSEGAD